MAKAISQRKSQGIAEAGTGGWWRHGTRPTAAGVLAVAGVVVILTFGVTAALQASAVGARVKEVTLRVRVNPFQQETITVSKGQLIRLTITSLDTSHTILFEGLGPAISVGPSETVTREFRVQDPGTYRFYCAIPEHRGVCIDGTLRVTE